MSKRLAEHPHRVLKDRAAKTPLTAWRDQTPEVQTALISRGYVNIDGELTDDGRAYLAEHADQNRPTEPGLI